MKEERVLVVELDRKLRVLIDGAYFIISNPEDVKMGDIGIARYHPEDQFCRSS